MCLLLPNNSDVRGALSSLYDHINSHHSIHPCRHPDFHSWLRDFQIHPRKERPDGRCKPANCLSKSTMCGSKQAARMASVLPWQAAWRTCGSWRLRGCACGAGPPSQRFPEVPQSDSCLLLNMKGPGMSRCLMRAGLVFNCRQGMLGSQTLART